MQAGADEVEIDDAIIAKLDYSMYHRLLLSLLLCRPLEAGYWRRCTVRQRELSQPLRIELSVANLPGAYAPYPKHHVASETPVRSKADEQSMPSASSSSPVP